MHTVNLTSIKTIRQPTRLYVEYEACPFLEAGYDGLYILEQLGATMTDETKLTELTLLKKGETRYPTSPDNAKLEVFENANQQRNYWVSFNTSEFTSLCPITGQPDFATIQIEYIPNKLCVESKSLKLYLFSFRQTGTFYEEIVNRIYSDLEKTLKPKQLVVTGDFTARGGITSSVKIDSSKA